MLDHGGVYYKATAVGLQITWLHQTRDELKRLGQWPEEADRDRLLSGPQGRLLANILGAIGLDESAAYIAAALPPILAPSSHWRRMFRWLSSPFTCKVW